MKFRKLFGALVVALLALPAMSCGGGNGPKAVESIAIANKEALAAEWHVQEADRQVKITVSPDEAYSQEVMHNIKIASSDTNVVNVLGNYLHAVNPGTATVSIVYNNSETIKDSVDLTVMDALGAPDWQVKTLTEVMALESGDPTVIYATQGKIDKWDKTGTKADDRSKYGNTTFKDTTEGATATAYSYGVTATQSLVKEGKVVETLAYDMATKTYGYNNPKDFLTNLYTKDLKLGDVVDLAATRADYKGSAQIKSVIRGVNGVVVPNMVQTTDEVMASPFQNDFAVQVTGKIVSLDGKANDGSEYGNVTIQTEGSTKPLIIWGLTATKSALAFNDKGALKFTNPKDFLTNDVTKALKVGDTITVNGVRCDYKEKIEIQGYLEAPKLSFAEGNYDVEVGKDLEVKAELLFGVGEIAYATEDATIATVDAATGKVTAVKEGITKLTATCGTLTATTKIHAYVKMDRPAPTVKTLGEVLLDETGNKKIAFETEVKVVEFAGRDGALEAATEFGGMNVSDAEGNNKVYVDGTTANLDALSWSEIWHNYSFSNPKDFLKNEKTKVIKVGDTLKINAVRNDYKGAKQLLATIVEVNGNPTQDVDEIRLDVTTLGIGAYGDEAVKKVSGVAINYIQLGNYGGAAFFQARAKSGKDIAKTSRVWNSTATPKAIDYIEFVYNAEKTGDNVPEPFKGIFGTEVIGDKFKVGDAYTGKDAYTVSYSTDLAAGTFTYKMMAPEGSTFFSLLKVESHTIYMDAIIVHFVAAA